MRIRDTDELLINPKPNTAAARAREFGVDLTLTLSNLRLTPEGRLLRLELDRMKTSARIAQAIRGAASELQPNA